MRVLNHWFMFKMEDGKITIYYKCVKLQKDSLKIDLLPRGSYRKGKLIKSMYGRDIFWN